MNLRRPHPMPLAAVVSVCALILPAGARAATAFSPGSYHGRTSQGEVVTVRLSNPHLLALFQVRFTARCATGNVFSDTPTVRHAHFSGNRFSGPVSYQSHVSGVVGHVTMRLTGHPTGPSGVRGTVRVTVRVYSAMRLVDTCHTATLTYSARRS